MAEAAIAIVAEQAAVGCINQIKHQFNYLSQYHENMGNLNTKLENLETRRADVQDRVFKATDKGETIMPNVQKWLREVGGKKEEAEEILKDKERVEHGCWNGWCVNLKLRYNLSKKAMKKYSDLDTFLAGGVFEIVAPSIRPLAHVFDEAGASSSEKTKNDIDHQILEVEGNEESKEGTTSNLPTAGADGGLTSRSEFLEKVMVAVKDPKIRIIRICGMGGIGKTTVAKQVKQMATTERLFHEIAMVEVNKNPDLTTLQLNIAELFGLELKEVSVTARAKRLHERMNAKDQNGQNKRILLILDNVWEKKDLEDAGVPLTDEKSLCKILLTSRSVLVCKDIAPEPEFNIGVLPSPESLILFLQFIPKEPPFYDQKMAEDLVKECGGLPIFITVIAGAVAGREEVVWTNALRKLQKSKFNGDYNKVFKVSYDSLDSDEIRSFFRVFCFFRKGSDVPIEDLARYGMVLRCFPNSDKLYEARDEAHSNALTLLHSNLLLRGDKEGCFKVHDKVWDFLVSAPSNDLFVIDHGDALVMSPTTDKNKKYTSMSLQCNETIEVPKRLDIQLKFLQLIGKSNTLPLKFPNNFYEEMQELNVLAFRSLKFTSLPKSLHLLKNLLSLSFDRCSIDSDISIIGNLVKLEILSFAHSNIEELPIQIANLKELRLLDVTGCDGLLEVAPNVLSELSSLEELYMRGTPLELGTGSPKIYSEIASMSKLVVLDIVMPFDEVPPMDSLFAKLNNFKISVTTTERGEEDGYILENYLDLECDSTVLQQRGVKLLLQETVRMDLKVTNLKNLFPLFDSEEVNFSKLQKLSIKSCNEMVYLVSLGLYGSNETDVAPFCNLKVLNVESCHKLEHLLSSSDARSLNRLEVIEVKSCEKLKVVLGKGRRGEEKVELRNLKKMTLEDLPNLVGFCSDVEAPEFPQLEELYIRRLPSITSIIEYPEIGPFDSSHRDDSSSHPLFSYKGLDTARKFEKLRSLNVYFCDSLRHLLTTSIAISFRELQYLRVWRCKSLTTLIAEEGIKEEKEKNSATEEVMLFPTLKVFDLSHLTSLSAFMSKGYTLTWSSLKILQLNNCGGEWNTLFPTPNKSNIQGASNKFALSSLEELNLEGNIPSKFWYDYFPHGFSYELREFNVWSSKLSIIMFSHDIIREFQHLTTIWVKNCESMEVLFDLEEECTVGKVESKLATLNKLDSLYIKEVPTMVNIWKKVPQNFQGFGNLTCLTVGDCDSLRYLFVPSIAKCLVKLKEMQIEDCKLIEKVVFMGDEEGELSDDIILFPQLEYLRLINLPSLKYLEAPNVVEAHDDVNATSTSTSNIISNQESIDRTSPALVTLEGNVCPWPGSFHKLKTIEVKSCNNLLYIFPPNRVVRLPLLEDISVKYCEHLQYIFSSSTAKSLEQQTELRIEGCKMMTEVIREDEEEEVDGRIKVVFHSLESLYLEDLPNLEGICLGMVSFDWPLLTSLKINYCLKMRIFTSGYSTTPLLHGLEFNGESYNPKMEEGDLNTVLRNAQLKAIEYLQESNFQLAGDHLIAHYSTWSWESLYSNSDRKGYLIARQLVVEKQDQDQNEVEVDPAGDDDMNIYKPRTYEVNITYDRFIESTRFWLKGYDESNMDLVFQDINMKYLEESHVTIGEDHPYRYGRYVSLFPSEKSGSIAKLLFMNLIEHGFEPTVQNHLQLFVDELFPNFQFGPAR